MKSKISATFTSVPTVAFATTRKARLFSILATMVATTCLIIAMSADTEQSRTKYFLDNGSVISATKISNVNWNNVKSAYPNQEKR